MAKNNLDSNDIEQILNEYEGEVALGNERVTVRTAKNDAIVEIRKRIRELVSRTSAKVPPKYT